MTSRQPSLYGSSLGDGGKISGESITRLYAILVRSRRSSAGLFDKKNADNLKTRSIS